VTRGKEGGPVRQEADRPSACVSLISLGEIMEIEAALLKSLTQFQADGRSEHTQGQYRRHITPHAT
jgi:hypothetical protein